LGRWLYRLCIATAAAHCAKRPGPRQTPGNQKGDAMTAARERHQNDLTGLVPESWHCVDCGVNTAPGLLNRADMERAFTQQERAGALLLAAEPSVEQRIDEDSEVYCLRQSVWRASGVEDFGGCLCIGCLERRLGRKLKPKDFRPNHPFNGVPGTPRLIERRGR
jgi:hypothetical protein